MKKAILFFVIMAGVATTTQAQKATKRSATTTEIAQPETANPAAETAEVEVKEVPVYDQFGNQSGVKKVKIDREGNIIPEPEEIEAEKARRMELEAQKN